MTAYSQPTVLEAGLAIDVVRYDNGLKDNNPSDSQTGATQFCALAEVDD